jgi:hypothetical protein
MFPTQIPEFKMFMSEVVHECVIRAVLRGLKAGLPDCINHEDPPGRQKKLME